jgi:hypothetical protein
VIGHEDGRDTDGNATGVTLAGASAGLVVAPFGDAVQRLPALQRARTLTAVSCGTGWGVTVAAPIIAILAGTRDGPPTSASRPAPH